MQSCDDLTAQYTERVRRREGAREEEREEGRERVSVSEVTMNIFTSILRHIHADTFTTAILIATVSVAKTL